MEKLKAFFDFVEYLIVRLALLALLVIGAVQVISQHLRR